MKSKLTFLDNVIFYTVCVVPLILFIIFTLKSLAVIYNYASPEFGSWPDWLSLLTNIAIAFITGYLARNAKNFFHDKVHAEGFNRASIMMDDIDNLYTKYNRTFAEVHRTVWRLDASLNRDNIHRVSPQKVLDEAEELLDKVSGLQADLFTVRVSIQKLSRWSIKNNQQNLLSNLMDSLENNIDELNKILSYLTSLRDPELQTSDEQYRDYILHSGYLKQQTDFYYNRFAVTPFKTLFSVIDKDKPVS